MEPFVIGQFTCTKELGSGATGKVYLGQHLDGTQVAVKVLNSQHPKYESLRDSLHTEINTLKRLNHENIVKLIQARFDVQWIQNGQAQFGDYIVTELMPNGELYDFIDNKKGRLEEKFAKIAFKQILASIAYLHRQGIVSRDIKLENLLVSSDYKIKLADLGFAGRLEGIEGNNLLESRVGSPGYMAPEMVELNTIGYNGQAVDTFALGVVLFLMVTQATPF